MSPFGWFRRSGVHKSLFLFAIVFMSFFSLGPPSFIETQGNSSEKLDSPLKSELASGSASVTDSDTKLILFYTTYWRQHDFQFGRGNRPFHDYGCPVKNCRVTTMQSLNQSATTSALRDFDAVLFSVQAHDQFDILEHQATIDLWRSPHQRFVFFIMESQAFPIRSLGDMNGFFNWTMTFRWDSDVPRPYGWFEEIDKNKASPFYPHKTDHWIPYDEQKFRHSLPSRPQSFHDLARRPGKIAWIVSNCDTDSKREDYVFHLRKYLEVHEFGGKCQHWSSPICDQPYSISTVDNCTTHIQENYKFYLAFENQFCNDYVTEKFFQRMEHSVVITLGQANYSEIAPPHSSISVFDFDKVQDLATYILELDEDDERYLSYFWWKDHYNVRHSRSGSTTGFGNGFGPSMCHLCAKLHDPDEPPKIYGDMERWWRTSAQCGKKLHGLQPRIRQDPRLPGLRTAGRNHHIDAFVRKHGVLAADRSVRRSPT